MEQINLNPMNKTAHLSIEKKIVKIGTGILTMSLRVNGKQIVDIVFREIETWKTT